jgi:transposase InsO family protein
VNPKRVYRILREDNLLCIRKRKFVATTDSNHGRKIYPNLARTMMLTGMDQLWVADITYIRLREEFVFLAVILDACSRRVIGWALDRTLKIRSRWLPCAWLSRTGSFSLAWSITPTAARSTPAAATRIYSKKTESA